MPFEIFEDQGGTPEEPLSPEVWLWLQLAQQQVVEQWTGWQQSVEKQAIDQPESSQSPATPQPQLPVPALPEPKVKMVPPSVKDIGELLADYENAGGELEITPGEWLAYGRHWEDLLPTIYPDADTPEEILPILRAVQNEPEIVRAIISAVNPGGTGLNNPTPGAWGLLFALAEDESIELQKLLLYDPDSSMVAPQILFAPDAFPFCDDSNPLDYSFIPLYNGYPFGLGGRYGQGTIEIPAQMLGLEGDGVVAVDVFVPQPPGGQLLRDPNSPLKIYDPAWQTVQFVTPGILPVPGSGNVSQQLGLSMANSLWGSSGQSRLVIPARFPYVSQQIGVSAQPGLVIPILTTQEAVPAFWDREHFTQWQYNQHRWATSVGLAPDQFSNPSSFDAYDSSALPQIVDYRFTAVPAPRGNVYTPSLLAQFTAVNDKSGTYVPFGGSAAVDYFNTVAPGLETPWFRSGIQDAVRDRDRQTSDFLPNRDTMMVGFEIQQTTEEDGTSYRAIAYGWQYFTVAEPDFSDPGGSLDLGPLGNYGHDSIPDARMMHVEVGSYMGALGIYPVFMNDLTGEDNWRGSTVPSVQPLYWNQGP
jgi:hypothetical protein